MIDLPADKQPAVLRIPILILVIMVLCIAALLLVTDYLWAAVLCMSLALALLVVVGLLQHRTSAHNQALQDVLDASPSGILCVNLQGVILFANPIAASIFDYTPATLRGMSVESLIPADIRPRHPQLRDSFLRERRSRRMGEGRDIRGITRTGIEVPLEIGLTFMGQGDQAMIIVGVIDIRDLKDAQDIIRRQNLNLARSVKELEQFAFAASHDLREPLRKVMNYIEILQEDHGSQVDDDGRQVLDAMGAAVQRMERLLDSLLSYSRVTTKAQPFESVALQDVLADVLEDLSLMVRDSAASIQTDALPAVVGDRNQLRQLFQNLVSNSLKYHRKDITPSVWIGRGDRPAPNGDRRLVCIEVRDNGIGFDNQYSELIFDVFKRLHGRDQYPGTGMGLAICRKIVDRHEGLIAAQGAVNDGATFFVWLKQA